MPQRTKNIRVDPTSF